MRMILRLSSRRMLFSCSFRLLVALFWILLACLAMFSKARVRKENGAAASGPFCKRLLESLDFLDKRARR